ncbi:hypothetical protein Trydic_g1939 [Trypoxylus dichotomus]
MSPSGASSHKFPYLKVHVILTVNITLIQMKLFTKRIFISDLPPNLTEDDLKEKFSKFGSIDSLEVRHRKQISARNKYPTYAYVTLNTDHYNLQQCFEDFTKHEWKGHYVEIQIAKENFLEKLKQERESEKLEKTDTKKEIIPTKITLNESVKRKHFHSSNSSNNSEEETGVSKKVKSESIIHNAPEASKKLRSNIFHETELSDVRTSVNSDINFSKNEVDNKKQSEKSNTSDQRRLHSISEMKKAYQQKKNAIKAALMNVDTTPNNKVIFTDDDHDQAENSSLINTNVENVKNNVDRKLLFQDEDDDMDDKEFNFDVKEQFQGKEGRKLMELQLKFKNDKRFALDERFLEDDQIFEDEEDTTKNAYKPELSDEANDAPEVTEEEKQKELAILEEVLGKKLSKSKDIDVSKRKSTKSLGMVRFDPANPEHSKYVLKQEDQVKEKPKKKKELVSTTTIKEDERPVVSKKTFYEVEDNLKQALEQDKPFSLLSLFGANKQSDDHEASSEPIPIQEEKPFKADDKNPFRYDSSDDNSENEDDSKRVRKEHDADEAVDLNNCQNVSLGATKLWREPFFFRKDDYRFQEGVDFVRKFALDDNTEFKEVRRNIKEICISHQEVYQPL